MYTKADTAKFEAEIRRTRRQWHRKMGRKIDAETAADERLRRLSRPAIAEVRRSRK
jgi:hypothetical protein